MMGILFRIIILFFLHKLGIGRVTEFKSLPLTYTLATTNK
jgi:hypothetical protein